MLIIDEIACLPMKREKANGFSRSWRSARTRVNDPHLETPRDSWVSAFAGDGLLTVATLDSILRHSIIASISGESFRLEDKRKAGVRAVPGKSPRR